MVSIVIPNYNGERVLRNCIYTVQKYTKVPYEIIVVDNGSTDGSLRFLESTQVKIIKNTKNLGFSMAMNQGIREATGEYILWLNNDVIIKSPSWITALLAILKEDPTVGVVGPRGGVLNEDDFSHVGKQHPFFKGEVDYIEGWCLLTKRNVVDIVGLLDESFFMFAEDSDWCLRVREEGYKVIQIPNVPILHLGSFTIKTQTRHNINATFDYREVTEQSENILREKWKERIKPLLNRNRMETEGKILIIRLHANGDILNTTPAIRQLKINTPEAYIGYLCLEECKDMLENNTFIDKLFIIKDSVIDPEIYNISWNIIYDLSDTKYHTIDITIAKLIQKGARYKKGHPLMNQTTQTRKERGGIQKKYVDIFAEMVGVKLEDKLPVFNTTVDDKAIANELVPQTNLKKVALCLDSGWPSRNYPKHYIKKLIKMLSQKYFVILLGLNRGLNLSPNMNFLNLMGKTKRVGIIYEIIRDVDLYIGVDTLPIHFAAMLNIPTIGLWNVTESTHVIAKFPDKFIPLQATVPCGPCYEVNCKNQGELKYICYNQLFPQRIFGEVERVFE